MLGGKKGKRNKGVVKARASGCGEALKATASNGFPAIVSQSSMQVAQGDALSSGGHNPVDRPDIKVGPLEAVSGPPSAVQDVVKAGQFEEEKKSEVMSPLWVNVDAVRIGPQPRCSLSEPDLATVEYSSGWLSDDHAIRIASLLSERFYDDNNKDDDDMAMKEFASLLGDGDGHLFDGGMEEGGCSDSMGGRLVGSGSFVSQLEDVAGDFGLAYEEMEQRIAVCSMVGGAVLRGMVTAVVEEASETLSAKNREMGEVKAVVEEQDVKIAQLHKEVRRKEGELATLIKEFQFHESKYVGDLLREKEVVLHKAREKERCVLEKERELAELASNLVYLSLQLDAESKKVSMLEKQMKDLRDAQALKVREIADLIEETERMKYDKESALELVKRESRLRELRVKETLELVLEKKEGEVESAKKQRMEQLDKIQSLECMERKLRQELSACGREVAHLESSKMESLKLVDTLTTANGELTFQNRELTQKLEQLLKQMESRDEHVSRLELQAWAAAEECSIILGLWKGKMADVVKAFQAIRKEMEREEEGWAERLSDQSHILEDTLQELDHARALTGDLEKEMGMFKVEAATHKENLESQVEELNRKVSEQWEKLDVTCDEVCKVKLLNSRMEQEIEELKLESQSLKGQLKKQKQMQEAKEKSWSDKLAFQSQENCLNVQELNRLQDLNSNMSKDNLQLKLDAALQKGCMERLTEELNDTRRCWADDKSHLSRALEEARDELASVRGSRDTLEKDVGNLKWMLESLERQQKEWEAQGECLTKQVATYSQLMDEKSIELVGLRFLKEELEHKLVKVEHDRLLTRESLEEQGKTLGEKCEALYKLERDFYTYVENMSGVYQKAFQHEMHLEALKEDMWCRQWRLEMEVEMVFAVLGTSVEKLLQQADTFAGAHLSVVQQLGSCLDELEHTKTRAQEQSAVLEDVQAAHLQLSEFSSNLCGEIESCNEEISRCKDALCEATGRAERSKADFFVLQRKMADMRLSLEERLHCKMAQVAELKQKLIDGDLKARESEWRSEVETSLLLHAVDGWRANVQQVVACHQEKEARTSEMLRDETRMVEWEQEIQSQILASILEGKTHELASALKASKLEVAHVESMREALRCENAMLQQEGRELTVSLKDAQAARELQVKASERFLQEMDDQVTSKLDAVAEEVNKALSDLEVKLAHAEERIEEEAWRSSVQVGIVCHLLAVGNGWVQTRVDVGGVDAAENSIVWDRVFDGSVGLLEEEELLKVVRREGGEASRSGLGDEARLKVHNNSLVRYIKAKMYEWSREKDMVIAEKTEEVYKLKRELLKEREAERAGVIASKEKEIQGMRRELEREGEGSLVEQHGSSSKLLEMLKSDWECEKSRLLDLVCTREQEHRESMLKVAEEHEVVVGSLRGRIAEREGEVEEWLVKMAQSQKRADESEARVGELMQEVGRLNEEVGEERMERDRLVAASEATESALQVALEELGTERRHKGVLEEELQNLLLYSGKVEELDGTLVRVSGELQEQRQHKERLESELQAHKREMLLVLRETALDRKRTEYEMSEQLKRLEERLEVLDHKVVEKLQHLCFRVEGVNKQVKMLKGEMEALAAKEAEYLRKISKHVHNLQTAEEEVDLLGDEVDALLAVLEKADSVLDHYSPVLQHYPGMIELVKLVRQAVIQRMNSSVAKQVTL